MIAFKMLPLNMIHYFQAIKLPEITLSQFGDKLMKPHL